MLRRIRDQLVIASTMALFALPLLAVPQMAEAQDGGRFRVMIPNFEPTDGTRDRFGQRVANNLRGAIDLDRHVGMSERDMDRIAREYDMRARDLDCLDARQLASLVQVPLVLCADYQTEEGQLRVTATVYTVPGMEAYVIPPFLTPESDERGATNRILEHFEVMAEQVLAVDLCAMAYASNDYERSLTLCTRALDLAPESQSARIALAGTFMELENFEQALGHFERVLAADEWNGDVLLNAGYAASQLGDTDKARAYYTRYLGMNPGSVEVRLRVAYDLAQAGDPEGAMAFVEEGLQEAPEDMGLLEAYGSYAFRSALGLQSMAPPSQDGDMDPEVARLFRIATETLMRVVEEEGAESNPGFVVNAMRAHMQLNEDQEALRIAERGVQIFPEAANIWSEKGTVHNRLRQTDDAVRALERAMAINPDFPGLRGRMGNYLVQAGRVNDGLPYLRAAMEAGEWTADQVVNSILSDAHTRGIQQDRDLGYAIAQIEMAKSEFQVSTELRQQLDFWHGWAVFSQARRRQEPNTVQSAQATRPEFVRARELLQAGQPFVQRSGVIPNFAELIENVNTFIEIQDAIIRRGGSR
jgi:tetratricopeptide (TPR) repeat protein